MRSSLYLFSGCVLSKKDPTGFFGDWICWEELAHSLPRPATWQTPCLWMFLPSQLRKNQRHHFPLKSQHNQSVSHTKWKGQFQVKGQSRWEMNVVKVRKNLKRNQNLDLLRILPRSLRRRRKRRKPNKLRKVMRLGTGKVWGGFTIAVIYIPHYTHLMWSTTSAMFSIFTNVLCFMLAC